MSIFKSIRLILSGAFLFVLGLDWAFKAKQLFQISNWGDGGLPFTMGSQEGGNLLGGL